MTQWQRRKEVMLCYPLEEKRLLKWEPPFIVQPKLDGVRCRAVPLGPQVYVLISSEGNLINSVPHITAALNMLDWDMELDGELYSPDLSFEEIVSRTSRTANIHSGREEISYYIFDIISDQPQHLRTKELLEKFQWSKPESSIKKVKSKACFTLQEVMDVYLAILDAGYEGIVVRNAWAPYVRKRSTYMLKFKPKKDDVYPITGYKEEYDQFGSPKGRLGALICQGGDTFSVGSGFTASEREELWENRDSLIGKLCYVEYQHITPGRGVPRFPVFVSIVDPKEGELNI